MTLESMYYAAKMKGDVKEAERLAKAMERLDEQAKAYGRYMRGETSDKLDINGEIKG